jgi:hypothetical protein
MEFPRVLAKNSICPKIYMYNHSQSVYVLYWMIKGAVITAKTVILLGKTCFPPVPPLSK